MGASWLEDFDKYVGMAGDAIETVQKAIQPPTPQTTVPVTPKQAQADTKTAEAESTDTQKTTISPQLIAVAAVIGLLLFWG